MEFAQRFLDLRIGRPVQIKIIILTLFFCSMGWSQLGPLMGPPTLLTVDSLGSTGAPSDGLDHQFVLTTGSPIYKSSSVLLISQLNYQNLKTVHSPLTSVRETEFQSLSLSLNATITQENGDGWLMGGSFGSASDELFANSNVVTYNLILQRKNKLSENRFLYYGIFYSNNNALLPGLPIPNLTYEIQNPETGSFFRIGFPLIARIKDVFPQTELGMFAIGPVIWDVFLKNTTLSDVTFTLGLNKRPETFLLSNPTAPPLDQLMIEQVAAYTLIELRPMSWGSVGLKIAYNFTNHFRLRETGTTRDDFDQDRRFADYTTIGLNIKFFPPGKKPEVRPTP
jgi:hypothetical protein